jgi:hypothetical protein
LLYWSDEFDKLGEDESVVEAFQCIQQSETIHPFLRGFVNNDDEWEYFIDILKMIHRADGKYKFLPVYVGKCPVRDADGGYNLSCGGGRCKGCMDVDAFRNCASVDMLLTLHNAISSMTDGVFSAEGMIVPAVVVNGRPHCPLPPRPSKSASKKKQYYCEDVAGLYYQDDGSPYQGSKLPVHYCPDITSPEAVIVAKGLNLFGKLARELNCKPMFINVAGKSGKKVMSKLDSTLFFVHDEMFHMSNISTHRTSYGTREEQTTKVTQLLDGLEERVEWLFEESATLKLKGAIGSAFVDDRFKYYGSDATIKEKVRSLEEKQEEKRKAELATKEEKRQKREEKRKAELAIKEEKRQKREEKRKAELAIKEERQKRKLAQEEKWKAEGEKWKAERAIKEERQKRKLAQEEKWKAEGEKWKAERAIREERLQMKRALEEKWIATGDRKTPAIEISSGSGGDDFPSGWIVKTYRRACGETVGTAFCSPLVETYALEQKSMRRPSLIS